MLYDSLAFYTLVQHIRPKCNTNATRITPKPDLPLPAVHRTDAGGFGTVHRILHSLHHRFQADSTQRSALAGCNRDRLFHRVGDILDQKAEIADICRSTMAL